VKERELDRNKDRVVSSTVLRARESFVLPDFTCAERARSSRATRLEHIDFVLLGSSGTLTISIM
jgi:hypothetical protein